MFEVIKNGGWMMFPIILCSIVAMAIIGERFWSLRRKRIIPKELVPYIWQLHRDSKLDDHAIRRIKLSSPLGRILAAGLLNRKHGREMMRTSIEEVGRQVAHELENVSKCPRQLAANHAFAGLARYCRRHYPGVFGYFRRRHGRSGDTKPRHFRSLDLYRFRFDRGDSQPVFSSLFRAPGRRSRDPHGGGVAAPDRYHAGR